MLDLPELRRTRGVIMDTFSIVFSALAAGIFIGMLMVKGAK